MSFGGDKDASKKRKMAIMGVSSLLLVAMVVGVAVGVSNKTSSGSNDAQITTTSKAVQAVCAPTDYKETCISSLNSANPNTSDPKELIKIAFDVTIKSIKEAITNGTTALNEARSDPRTKQALDNCEELMEDAIDELKKSFDKLGVFEFSKLDEYVEDLRIWLSGAVTYQQTCIDGFENTTGDAGQKMQAFLKTAKELTSNGLAMVSDITSLLKSWNVDIPTGSSSSRRLLSQDGFPSWVDAGKRKLLRASQAHITADVVVAKDGSGKYTTVNDALKDIPKKNSRTFVIYIKRGIYNEQVLLTKNMPNVMFIGDGPTLTKITGRLNFAQGTNTYRTATVAIAGEHFMAKNIGFENTAGAIGHQAVALRVSADYAVFYNCQMDGYQDTLYTHTNRQFYRDCTISGTIDFIFGDAAVVFQNCRMIVRKPMENQQCIVTAQGRLDRHAPTGIVLQNCVISGEPAYLPVKAKNRAYLGRPWKQFSRTIIMHTQIDDIIDPEGWMPWQGTFALDTLYYGEFENRGPGSVQNMRVRWPGIKKISPQEAVTYTPGLFLSGDSWIPQTGVPYISAM